MRQLVFLLFLSFFLVLTADASNIISKQAEAVDAESIISALPEEAQNLLPDAGMNGSTDFWPTLGRIVKKALLQEWGTLAQTLRSCGLILLVVLICAAADCLTQGTASAAVSLAGAGTLLLICTDDLTGVFQAGTEAITQLHNLSLVLLPVMAGAAAATGAVSASSAVFAGSTLLLELFISLIHKILLPAVSAYLALSAASAAVDSPGLDRLRTLICSATKNCLRFLLLGFSAYLSITGILKGSADALAVKAAKMTISTMVPVVGGMVSDASETILVSARYLLTTTGILGMLAVMSVLIVPFIRLGIRYVTLLLTAAVCSLFAGKRQLRLLEASATATGFLLAMTCTCALMAFISCVCYMKVSVT